MSVILIPKYRSKVYFRGFRRSYSELLLRKAMYIKEQNKDEQLILKGQYIIKNKKIHERQKRNRKKADDDNRNEKRSPLLPAAIT